MQTEEDGEFLWRQTGTVSYLEPAALSRHPRLCCAFTTRHAGTSGAALNLSFDRAPRAEVTANRQRLLEALGLAHTSLHTVRQVHGNQVCVVDEHTRQVGLQGVEADALVTTLPQVPLGILVADCLPVVLYAHTPPVVAVVHAGRMGTYHGVVSRTVDVLLQRFGAAPEHLHAVLGPAIEACCYTLDLLAVRPFQERFPDWQAFFTRRGEDMWVMSLTTANTIQLCAAGVPRSHIISAGLCTSCHTQQFYSHRAERHEAGRCMAIAALLPQPE